MTFALASLAWVVTSAATTLTFTGDGSCGDERSIRDAITVRLGKDPFRDGQPGPAFVAAIQREGAAWVSQLSVDGGAARRRTSSDCRELSQSLALAIALVLETAPPPAPIAPPPPPSAPSVVPSLSVSAFASGGVSPTVTAGGAFAFGLRVGAFALELEGRVDVPAAVSLGGNVFRSFPVLFTASPGALLGPVRLTAPVTVGALFVDGPSDGVSGVVLLGAQVTGLIPIGPRFSLEPFVRGQASLNRISVLSGTSTVWVTWPLCGLVGVALRYDLAPSEAREPSPVP